MSDDQIISERTAIITGFAFLQLSLVLRGLQDGGVDFARAYKRLVLDRRAK